MKKTKVYVSILTNGWVVDSQEYALREIMECYKDHIDFVFPTQCVRRIFHDFARNSHVDDFLASDADILWFLDSDITPSKHVLDIVAVHKDKWEAAGSVYPIFMTPPGKGMADGPEVIFTCYEKNAETGGLKLRDVPTAGQEFVDGLATGCMFIKRGVFSKLQKPYFEHKFDMETRNLSEGEDLGFCLKLSKLGIRFFTDFAFICKHQKEVDLLDVANYAIMYANRSIETYVAMVKKDAQEAVKEAYKLGLEKGRSEALRSKIMQTGPMMSPIAGKILT